MVTAVPVRKFSLTQLAFSGTPFSDNQLAINSTFPARKMAPISPITMIFLIPKLIICPFKGTLFSPTYRKWIQSARTKLFIYSFQFAIIAMNLSNRIIKRRKETDIN